MEKENIFNENSAAAEMTAAGKEYPADCSKKDTIRIIQTVSLVIIALIAVVSFAVIGSKAASERRFEKNITGIWVEYDPNGDSISMPDIYQFYPDGVCLCYYYSPNRTENGSHIFVDEYIYEKAGNNIRLSNGISYSYFSIGKNEKLSKEELTIMNISSDFLHLIGTEKSFYKSYDSSIISKYGYEK